MPLKPYLQLVRLPNVFTAAADSLSGWLLVGGSLAAVFGWLPLAIASMAIYAAGIALNDRFDLEIDRAERPNRPLPSGQVSPKFASGLAIGLFGLGLVSAAFGGGSWRGAVVAALLIGSVVAYDVGIRRTVFGPELMGICRGLNVLLGMSFHQDFGGPIAWLVAGSIMIFIVGVTWISRSETEEGRRAGPTAGMILQGLAFLGLAIAGLRASQFPSPISDRPIVPVAGLLVLALVVLIVWQATGRAVIEPKPETLQPAVKVGVLSLIWLHVAVVFCVRGGVPALAIAALWVPSYLSGRWLYST